MTNLYEDPAHPDARQSHDPHLMPSRFRPVYRPLGEAEKNLHDGIKAKAEELEVLLGHVSEVRMAAGHTQQPRYHALAITALEEAIMWAVKGLTA